MTFYFRLEGFPFLAAGVGVGGVVGILGEAELAEGVGEVVGHGAAKVEVAIEGTLRR